MSDYFVFGDIDTRTYNGIYVYFDNIDETPEKVYETYEIPGRNGLFYMDQKRFEDAEHVYHIVALTESAASDLINALSSKSGYLRLSDSFHTSEFYSAVFTSIDDYAIPSTRDKATFKVIFTRKPQRFLVTGETPLTPTGSSLETNNQTLFDAKPLLTISGTFTNGEIDLFNSRYDPYEIILTNGDTGIVDLYDPEWVYSFSFASGEFNTSDEITVELGSVGCRFFSSQALEITSCTKTSGTLNSTSTVTEVYDSTLKKNIPAVLFDISQTITYAVGTGVTKTDTYTVNVKRTPSSGSAVTTAYVIQVQAKSNSTGFTVSASKSSTSPTDSYIQLVNYYTDPRPILSATGYSTVPIFNGTAYIDTEIGEAYKYNASNQIVSLNKYVSLGSELPVLTPGNNEFVLYGGVGLSVKPRWWKI